MMDMKKKTWKHSSVFPKWSNLEPRRCVRVLFATGMLSGSLDRKRPTQLSLNSLELMGVKPYFLARRKVKIYTFNHWNPITYPSPHFSFQLFWIIVAYPTHQNYCRLPLPSISIVPAAEDGIGGSAGLTVRRGHSWTQTIRMDLIFPYFRGTLPHTNFQALHMGRWSKTIQKHFFFF